MVDNDRAKKLSIITPVYNEAANVSRCAQACAEVMGSELSSYEYEHIFADNASTDETLEILRDLASKDSRIKVIANSRNVGALRNIANAMRSATGDAVVPMLAADLQDPAEVIPKFVDEWEAGSLVVYGIRANRNERLFLRAGRGLYYRILAWSGGSTSAPPHAGEFQLLDRQVVDSVLSVDDQYPYIRGLVAQTGARNSSVKYDWVERKAGRSKANFPVLLDQAANGFVTTSRAPTRLALLIGLIASIFGMGIGVFSLIFFAITRDGTATGIPTLVVGVFVLGGLQLFFIGLIGEYVLSMHGQVRRTPPMFEIERINLESGGPAADLAGQ
ncbi:MAG TPA: glycosyltransferase [Actinobacteria bacterium]|nr:glycosyltransferase [Actinomycetota bacterium]